VAEATSRTASLPPMASTCLPCRAATGVAASLKEIRSGSHAGRCRAIKRIASGTPSARPTIGASVHGFRQGRRNWVRRGVADRWPSLCSMFSSADLKDCSSRWTLYHAPASGLNTVWLHAHVRGGSGYHRPSPGLLYPSNPLHIMPGAFQLLCAPCMAGLALLPNRCRSNLFLTVRRFAPAGWMSETAIWCCPAEVLLYLFGRIVL
jgi:hypothetical protein